MDNGLDFLDFVVTDAINGGNAKVDSYLFGRGMWDEGASYEEVVAKLKGAEGMVDKEEVG